MDGERVGGQAFVSSFLLSMASMGAMAGLGYVDVVERAMPQALSGLAVTVFVFAVLIGTPLVVGWVVSRRWKLANASPVFFGTGMGVLALPIGVVVWIAIVDSLKLADAAIMAALLSGALFAASLFGAIAAIGANWERRRRHSAIAVPTANVHGD